MTETRNIRIMLVDDNESFRSTLQDWLHQAYAWTVDAVGSGEKALAQMEASAEPYDVLLLDKFLDPDKWDGLETLRYVRERKMPVKVVMFTQHDPSAGGEALRAGADRYITRPFGSEDLASLIIGIMEEGALHGIASKVSDLLDVPVCVVWQLNRAAGYFEVGAWVGDLSREFREGVHISADIERTRKLIEQKRAVAFRDLWEVEPVPVSEYRQEATDRGWVSRLSAPMIIDNALVGILDAYTLKDRDFTKHEESILSILADWAAVTVQSNNLTRHLQRISRLALSGTYPDLIRYVVAAARDLTGADVVLWMMSDKKTEKGTFFRIAAHSDNFSEDYVRDATVPLSADESITGLAIKERRSIVRTDIWDKSILPWFHNLDYAIERGWHGFMTVPMFGREEPLGSLSLYSSEVGRFRWLEVDLMRVFADQVAIALEQQQQSTQQNVFMSVSHKLAAGSTVELSEVLDAILKGALELTGTENSIVHVVDTSASTITHSSCYPKDSWHAQPRMGKEGYTWWIIQKREQIVRNAQDQADPLVNPKVRQAGVQWFVGTPLIVENLVVGVLYVNDFSNRKFTHGELESLKTLADQAAVAIENARRFEQERSLRLQAEKLRGISGAVNSARRLEDVSKDILDGLRELVHYKKATMQLIQGDSRSLLAFRGFKENEIDQQLLRPLSQDRLIKRTVAQNKPLILQDPSQDADWGSNPNTSDVKSWVGVPLYYGSDLIGLITLDHTEPGFYSPSLEFENLLAAVGNQAAMAIRNADLITRLQRQVSQHHILNDHAIKFAGIMDESRLFEEAAFAAGEILDATHCTIFYVGGNKIYVAASVGKLEASFPPGRDFKLGEGVAGWVAQQGETALVFDTSSDSRFTSEWSEKDQPKSLVVVPVLLGTRVWGVISAEQEGLSAFDEYDRQLLEALSLQFSQALRNVQLHKAEQERAQALSDLYETGQFLISTSDLHSVLVGIVERAQAILVADAVVLYEYNNAKKDLVIPPTFVGVREARPLLGSDEFHQQSVASEMIRSGLPPQYIPNARERDASSKASRPPDAILPFVEREGIQSSARLLLTAMDEIVGVLFVNYRAAHAFEQAERTKLELFASQAAVAIQNVRRLEEERRLRLQADTLREVSRSISAVMELKEAATIVLDGLAKVVPYDMAQIQIVEGDTRSRVAAAPADLPPLPEFLLRPLPQDHLISDIINKKRPRVLSDLSDPKSAPPEWDFVPETAHIKSWAGVPLVFGDKVIGLLMLEHQTAGFYEEKTHENLLIAFANQAAISIENARLYSQTDRQLRALRRIDEIVSTIGLATGDPIPVILEEIAGIFRSQYGSFSAVNRDTECYTTRAIWNVGQILTGDNIPLERRTVSWDRGIVGYVAKEGKPYRTGNVAEDPYYDRWYEGVASELAVPVRSWDGQTIGVLNLENNRKDAFSKADEDLVGDLAKVSAVALEKNELFATLQRLNAELESLQKVAQSQDWKQVMQCTLEGVCSLLGEGTTANIFLYREETKEWREGNAVGPVQSLISAQPRESGTGAHVLTTKKPYYLADATSVPSECPTVRDDLIAAGTKSFAALPLKWQENMVGVLFINLLKPTTFTNELQGVLELFASQAGFAIENARLHEQLANRVQELEVLTEIGRTVSNLDIDRILDLVYREMTKIIDLRDAQVQFAFNDELKDEVSFPLAVEQDKEKGQQFLFSVELAFISDLEGKNPNLSQGFRLAFEKSGVSVSADISKVTITTEIEGSRWRIDDVGLKRTYTVVRDTATLKVFDGEIDRVRWGKRDAKYSETGHEETVKQFMPRRKGERYGLTEYVIDKQESVLLFKEFKDKTARTIDDNTFALSLPLQDHFVEVAVWRRFGRYDRATNSWLGVPMIVQGRPIGIISVQSLGEEAPVDKDLLRVLDTVASQAAVAIENARLLEKEKRHVQQLEGLRRISLRIAASLDLQEVLHEIADNTNRILAADFTTIFPYTEKQGFSSGARAGAVSKLPSIPSDAGLLARIVLGGQIVEARDAEDYPDINREFIRANQVKSFIGIPVRFGSRPVGVIIANYQSPQSFRENERSLADQVAALAAVVIENATRAELIADRERYMTMIGLSADLVHRINNRAGTIPLRVQQLEEKLDPDNPKHTAILRGLQGIARDAKALLEESRGLERLEETDAMPESSVVSASERLQSIANKVRVECPPNIEVIEVIDPNLASVHAVAEELDNALWSVVQNGVEAMSPHGGRLVIQARMVEQADQPWIEIRITDEGPGISREIRDRLFEPFSSTKLGKYHGFGLWRARQVFRKSGGTIDLAESNRSGTTFVVHLPVV